MDYSGPRLNILSTAQTLSCTMTLNQTNTLWRSTEYSVNPLTAASMVSVPRSGLSSSIVCSQIDLGLRPRIQHSLIFGQLNKHLFSKNKTIQSNSFKSGHCVIIKLIKVTLITVENMINIKKKKVNAH